MVYKTVTGVMVIIGMVMACGLLALPQEKPVTVDRKTLGQ
jgi:hypothetical protein